MAASLKIAKAGVEAAWEDGSLGRSEEHVKRSDENRTASVDDALGLQMISLRLPKDLLEQLKVIAKYHRIGYQPMVRDVIGRWARTELTTIAESMRKELAAKETLAARTGTPKGRKRA